MSAPDRYDEAIAFLTKRVRIVGDTLSIYRAWQFPESHRAGCLFTYVGSNGCGCLTHVRKGLVDAATPELTAAIRADTRIPTDPRKITVGHLPVFAEWQRRIDHELGRP